MLRYLGRYTHRVAISNHRLIGLDGERVTFRWKDYAHGSTSKVMTLAATEFLRRFFLHVLPKGFVRIRAFGFLANRFRTQSLVLCRQLLAVSPPVLTPDSRTGCQLALPSLRSTYGTYDSRSRQRSFSGAVLSPILLNATDYL